MHEALQKQIYHNAKTASLYDSYASHRNTLSQLITGSVTALRKKAEAGSVNDAEKQPAFQHSLLVLGAGNGNDLEASVLADCFTRIDLVDIDEQAMTNARDKLTAAGAKSVGITVADLTGLFADSEPSLATAAERLERSRANPPSVGEAKYDCVVSTCALSQLIDATLSGLDKNDPQMLDLVVESRTRHLQWMLDNLRNGGIGILCFDFVSSDTLPMIRTTEPSALSKVMTRALANGNFFTGCNPFAIHDQLAQWPNSPNTSSPANPAMHPPWRWDLGERSYLVTALAFLAKR